MSYCKCLLLTQSGHSPRPSELYGFDCRQATTARGGGLGTQGTGLTYLTNTWQEWDLEYQVGASIFTVCVAGSCAGGFASPTVGDVSQLDLFNGSATSGSLFIDAVPTTPAQTPLPGALPLFATGLGALSLLGWHRKKKAAA
jgi:hypothetical protein